MNRKTLLITGASGFIGEHLCKCLELYKPFGLTRQGNLLQGKKTIKCDLTNKIELKKIIMGIKPDIIYHLAALTNPQRNETFPDEARLLNVDITNNLVESIDKEKTHLIFLSTDKVFDGSNIEPDENSKTDPLWIYGKFKLECETIIRDNLPKHHILRLPIVHGNGTENSSSFIDQALIDLRSGQRVKSYKNIKRCYVKVAELIELMKILVNDSHYGIYHAGSRKKSYYLRMKKLCEENNIAVNNLLIPVLGNVKPIVQNLNTKKLEQTFNFSFS
jgi:dTDP-4-dehydrorhamnose reductase